MAKATGRIMFQGQIWIILCEIWGHVGGIKIRSVVWGIIIQVTIGYPGREADSLIYKLGV